MRSIIINGGGLSGAILALVLSYLTHDKLVINLIEAVEPSFFFHPCYDTRSIVLSESTKMYLVSFGIWSLLSPYATPIKEVEIGDSKCINKIIISANDYQLSALGYVIKLGDIASEFFQLLKKKSNIRLFCPERFKHVIRKDNIISVILNNNYCINAQLIVAADGSCSKLASYCGIEFFVKDYQQFAVIVSIITSLPNSGKAFEIFTRYGILTFLPFNINHGFIVWCLPIKLKSEIESWSSSYFLNQLQFIFGWSLGSIIDVGDRYFYNLKLFVAKRHISHRLVLIGNAAQTLHPIAAQGFNLSIRDIVTLANIVSKVFLINGDIGDYNLLMCYQESRKLDQKRMVRITDCLVELFINSNFALFYFRKLGFLTVSVNSYLRDFIIKYSLGWLDGS